MNTEDYIINGISLEGIRNSYETKVVKMMRKEIPDYPKFDHCRVCIEDVYALVLSRIPSTYVAPGSIVFRKDLSEADLKEVVRYAIFQVIQQPKHSKN